jgi:hypothetical protein
MTTLYNKFEELNIKEGRYLKNVVIRFIGRRLINQVTAKIGGENFQGQ